MKTMKAGTFMVVFCQKNKHRDDEGRRRVYCLTLIESEKAWAAAALDTCDLPVATLRGLLVPRRPTTPQVCS
jgi:hypothetical protein